MIASLTPDRLDAVLRPKVDAAWNLHELTQDLDLSAFVLFSSVAGVLGAPGRATTPPPTPSWTRSPRTAGREGLPAVSLAWGLWAQSSGMTGELGEADLRRIGQRRARRADLRSGRWPCSTPATVAGAGRACPPVDTATPRTRRPPGDVPAAAARRWCAAPARRAGGGRSGRGGGIAGRAAGRAVPTAERDRHGARPGAHPCRRGPRPRRRPRRSTAERQFIELGFDSLTAVELRNRLNTATGLRLPATLIFDYPTSAALAGHILDELVGAGTRPRPRPVLADHRKAGSRSLDAAHGRAVTEGTSPSAWSVR